MLLAVLAIGFSSCVNEEYDPENINTEITIAGEGLSLPLGSTKQMTLKNLLSSMNDDMLQVLEGGSYALRINDTLNLGNQLPDLKDMLDIPDVTMELGYLPEGMVEIEEGKYSVSLPADICMTVDLKKFYRVGKGRLSHSLKGFALEGCDGELSYTQSPTVSYSLFSDFNWYEIGDLVCIGNSKTLYYCFPETEGDIVAKMRLATEETYKLEMAKKRSKVTLTKQEASPSDDQ